eukprot:Gregarina_sp_Poly_1__8480@NODE_4_length_26097_cov_247_784211_g3_i0_p11_GENE_NODE_4_length_26097_cov_247_784211_g3_i0NODE_4_length_26097_cov_247_784211_g3_i0_p11_ORF_typecomplete_len269_score33_60_NODE_4_length_26097_cov_247_784211_g3_i01794218748
MRNPTFISLPARFRRTAMQGPFRGQRLLMSRTTPLRSTYTRSSLHTNRPSTAISMYRNIPPPPPPETPRTPTDEQAISDSSDGVPNCSSPSSTSSDVNTTSNEPLPSSSGQSSVPALHSSGESSVAGDRHSNSTQEVSAQDSRGDDQSSDSSSEVPRTTPWKTIASIETVSSMTTPLGRFRVPAEKQRDGLSKLIENSVLREKRQRLENLQQEASELRITLNRALLAPQLDTETETAQQAGKLIHEILSQLEKAEQSLFRTVAKNEVS